MPFQLTVILSCELFQLITKLGQTRYLYVASVEFSSILVHKVMKPSWYQDKNEAQSRRKKLFVFGFEDIIDEPWHKTEKSHTLYERKWIVQKFLENTQVLVTNVILSLWLWNSLISKGRGKREEKSKEKAKKEEMNTQ